MVDWATELKRHGEIAKFVAVNAVTAMAGPGLTLVQAFNLYWEVEKGAKQFDKIVDLLGDNDDATDAMIKTAATLQDIWSIVSILCAHKVLTMRGRDPFDLADDD